MELSQKLVKLRKESGLTQEQLAQKLFVTRTAVSKWENGKGYPGIDSLKLLAGFYGVSLDELVSDEDVAAVQSAKRRRSREFYWCAVACLIVTFAFAVATVAAKIPWLLIPSAVAAVGYVTFGFFSSPLGGLSRAEFIRRIVCRAIVVLIVLAVIITMLISSL